MTNSGAVENALAALGDTVAEQAAGDERYLANNRTRFTRGAARILEHRPPPARVLDIGSHYLHQSVVLSALGYEVTGMDVSVFSEQPFLRERAERHGITNEVVDDFAAGDFLADRASCFDVVVFTEILEHITFNPVRFWHRVYELLAPGGMIYVTTPNALRGAEWARSLVRLLTFDGVGQRVDEVFSNVTYGHHWKEYSAREIRRYFAALSPDFTVTTSYYALLEPDPTAKQRLRRLLDVVPSLRPEVEAIVELPAKRSFALESPELPINA